MSCCGSRFPLGQPACLALFAYIHLGCKYQMLQLVEDATRCLKRFYADDLNTWVQMRTRPLGTGSHQHREHCTPPQRRWSSHPSALGVLYSRRQHNAGVRTRRRLAGPPFSRRHPTLHASQNSHHEDTRSIKPESSRAPHSADLSVGQDVLYHPHRLLLRNPRKPFGRFVLRRRDSIIEYHVQKAVMLSLLRYA